MHILWFFGRKGKDMSDTKEKTFSEAVDELEIAWEKVEDYLEKNPDKVDDTSKKLKEEFHRPKIKTAISKSLKKLEYNL